MNIDKYKMNKKDIITSLLYVIVVTALLGKIFYGEWWYGVGLVPIGIYLFKLRKKDLAMEKKRNLRKQFKEMLLIISDLVNTGYSIESSIKESYKDLTQMYGTEGIICKEVLIMISQLKMNISVEKVIGDFASRIQLEEAYTFSQVFSVAKKKGGSMSEIIKNATDTIVLKENVREDVEVAIAEKKMEQKIMSIIPLALVGYISFASPGFLDVMYKTWIGRAVMSVSLICYMAAYIWSKNISEIKI